VAPARVASLAVDLMEDMSTVSATTTMMVDTMATAIPDMATRMLDTAETTDMVTVDIGMGMTMGMNTDNGMDMTTLHLEVAGDLASLARDQKVARASLARDHQVEEAGDLASLVRDQDHPMEAGVAMMDMITQVGTAIMMDITVP
jgi:hypothetical protein